MSWFSRDAEGVPDVRTPRLRLVAITAALLKADAANDGSLGKALGAELPKEWPPADWEPHVQEFIRAQFAERPESVGWHRYVLLVERWRKTTLIGAIGGFPRMDGDVEIGYSTLPSFQRRGFATEGVTALVQYLLGCEGVLSVSAQTTVGTTGSIKVMERCGMVAVGAGDEAGTVRYRRLK